MNLLSSAPVLPLRHNRLGETAHVFGDGLAGILHQPPVAAEAAPAVILLNAGMVQRMGPYRGSVQLARALAARGHPVLRFDHSGLGDSPVSARPAPDLRLAEVRAAIDLLATHTGARRFVVGGICSAADVAFEAASVEPRISGLLLLDGPCYRTTGWWWRHLLPRLADPARLRRWWRARGRGEPQPSMADFRDFPARADARARLRDLVARDVALLFVFTGGAYGYFNHARQLVAAYGRPARTPQVRLEYWPHCDHTFYLRRDRERLQDTVATWLRDRFPAPHDGA